MSRTPRTAAGASMIVALSSRTKPVPQDMIDLICDIEDQAGRAGRPRDQRVDWDAVEHLVDAAIRRGDISQGRGAEILGVTIRTWRDRALEIRDAGNPLATTPDHTEGGEERDIDVERLARAIHRRHNPSGSEFCRDDSACRRDAMSIVEADRAARATPRPR